MKKVFQLIFSLVMLFLTSSSVEAVTMNKNQALNSEKSITITPKQDEANSSSKKMNFMERLTFKVLQNKIQKALAFNKDKSNTDGSNSDNTLSLLSCIFGVLGLLLLFTGSSTLILLGLFVGIAGFATGLVGLKKENSKVLAIIGLVAGSLVLLIFIAAIILVASYL